MAYVIRQGINLHKWLEAPIYLLTILAFGWPQDSPACAAALFIGHTLYTMGWLFKDIHFPDPNFRQEAPLQVPAMGFIFCSAYYLPMFCLTSGKCFGMVSWGCDVTLMAIGFASYTVGMLFHFGSDCQKYFTLKYKTPRSLITDGFFSYSEPKLFWRGTNLHWIRSLVKELYGFRSFSCHVGHALHPKHEQERPVNVQISGIQILEREHRVPFPKDVCRN